MKLVSVFNNGEKHMATVAKQRKQIRCLVDKISLVLPTIIYFNSVLLFYSIEVIFYFRSYAKLRLKYTEVHMILLIKYK